MHETSCIDLSTALGSQISPYKAPHSTTVSMASHDDDHLPEDTQGYKLSQPKQSLAEYQQMGM